MPEFKIQHITRYTYNNNVRDSANKIILYPISDKYQEVLKHDLRITGNPQIDTYIDYYGNEVGSFTYIEPHNILVINSQLSVVTYPRPLPIDNMFATEQWNELYNLKYIVPYIDFLKQEYFEGLSELTEIVNAEKQTDDTPYRAALKFTKYVYKNFEYIKGVTTVETTLDEIWKIKAGVCQDFAHLLMVMLRSAGIPARYVSGYICPNKNGMRGEGATHAWAEAYLPGYGWLGIDPTNNCIANENHVRLAVGRNFSDCSPVKGVYKGSAQHRLEVSVSVGHEDSHLPEEKDIFTASSVPHKPAGTALRNSYERYMEMIQQQQQQQQ
ncbi:transglutaminase family protein [Mucilaginibacter sp. KACC 22063]|uniref:transglutaminase family protein n=1 Tax=Mucilaginibacter sp. KACC 22063 TaxID=3025666 RepID=UPI00236708A4|nr:transglutaminase family protein [Mucilaginibacter sp. KACC 22063]WDF54223.1 transglutaminase family protein [Mucilaginibacter sp. KACC 22063]